MGEARKDEDETFPSGYSFKKAEAAAIEINKRNIYDIRHKMEAEHKRSALIAILGELNYKAIQTILIFNSEISRSMIQILRISIIPKKGEKYDD